MNWEQYIARKVNNSVNIPVFDFITFYLVSTIWLLESYMLDFGQFAAFHENILGHYSVSNIIYPWQAWTDFKQIRTLLYPKDKGSTKSNGVSAKIDCRERRDKLQYFLGLDCSI